MLKRRLLLECLAIAIFTTALTAVLALTCATARLDNAYYDLAIGLRAPEPSDRIVIVAIDDASIGALGRWPWPRALHTEAVRRIASARPAALAYDILFTEAGDAQGDAALGTALATLPSVLPALTEAPGRDGRSIETVLPVPPIAVGARHIGHVVLPHEDDGTGRVALLRLDDGERELLHVMEWTYRLAFHRPSPAGARGELAVRVPFQPTAGGFRTVPFQAVVRGELPPEFLTGKMVLVGATAAGLGDRHRVPMRQGGMLAGIEVQANLLNALISDRLVREISSAGAFAVAILPSILLLLSFWLLRPAHALVASLGMITLMALVPAALLVWAGLWVPPAPALIGLLIAYPLWGWRRLQAVDAAISAELRLFAIDTPASAGARRRLLADPIGWQAAHLSSSIAQLRDLRRMIADAVEGVADPIIVTNLDEVVILANGPAKRLIGSALVGTSLSTTILPDQDEITIDGRVFSRRRTPLSTTEGEQRGWILLLAEITAIRRAEDEREAALQFLSHDMRSPQVSIVSLLESDKAAMIEPPLAARIRDSALRTLQLADDFVQLARLQHRPFAPEETDLCDAISEAMDALWAQAAAKGVRVIMDAGDEPYCLMGERHELTRMFVNLLGNAIRFSPAEGQVSCKVRMSDDPSWVIAQVADEGPGVDPHLTKSLFARFGSPANGLQSAGLGLSYVRAAAERHGGGVEYTDMQPHGACFVVRLPAL